MLSKNKNGYIKNLSFYYIKHFSKFIQPGSIRIGFSKFSDKFEMTAFKNPYNSVIIILLNKNDFNVEYNLKINEQILHDNLDSHAIVTFKLKL